MFKNESIFLGVTQSDARRYLFLLLKDLVERRPILIVPCCGLFTIAKVAIEAGYKPENIYCSDVSLFSELVAHVINDEPLDDVPMELSDLIKQNMDKYETTLEKVAYLLYEMKLRQIDTTKEYMLPSYNELLRTKDKQVTKISAQLEEIRKELKGVHYVTEDLRKCCTDEYEGKEVAVLNPPLFSKGYTKMFDFGEDIVYKCEVTEFDWKKEFQTLYDKSKETKAQFIWYRDNNVDGFPKEDVMWCKEFKIGKRAYWLATKPKEFNVKRVIKTQKPVKTVPLKYPIFGENDEVREDSKVQFVNCKMENSLYYRDLFAHKLGATKAERYFVMLVDGKVFGACGLMLQDLSSLKGEYVFEQFGFAVPKTTLYEDPCRLLLLAVTSEQFNRDVIKACFHKNRFFKCRGVRTTCLSKYRAVKTNQSIFRIEFRDKMDNGFYKIMYTADFRKDTFADCCKRFIEEEKEKKK